jgi:hypothetical protein
MLTGNLSPDDSGRKRVMTYPDNTGLEAPEADAAEQATDAFPGDGDDTTTPALGDETPEWDAQEQSRSVGPEDEYR